MGFLGERVDVLQVPWSRNLSVFYWCCVFFVDTQSYLPLSNSSSPESDSLLSMLFVLWHWLDKLLCACTEQIPLRGHSDRLRGRWVKTRFYVQAELVLGCKEVTAWEESNREQTTIFRTVLCVILIKRFFGELRALRYYRLWQSSPITWTVYSVLCSTQVKMQNLSKNGISASLLPCFPLPQAGRTQW